MVIVPLVASTGPLFRSWTGPTKLRLTVDGLGPKYERGTVAPTEGGAGNRLHPGPGPIGPGPGPWSELKVAEVAVVAVASSKLVGAAATGRLARACMARICGEIAWVMRAWVVRL